MILSNEELGGYLRIVDRVSAEERRKILQLLEMDRVARSKDSFLFFVKQMWPVFISGRHHKIMADAFERVARGELKRLIINMPPRHTKSEFASYLLPAWFLGKYPHKKVIQTAHTAELSVGFGRKVRNLVSSEEYRKIFNVTLSSDSKAAGRWNTHEGGDYFAIGVGGAVTGKGADLLIIDDPHSEQEAKQGNPEVYDSVYEWYTSGPRQRLQPGAAIIIVMCMTGDTPVLLADGTNKPLANIRPGDQVATFDRGRLTTSRVNNWQSSGVDAIYRVKTESGKILRANKRHPFLVMNEGVLEWTRVKHLKVGDLLVSLKDVRDLPWQKQSPGCATLVKPESPITENILTLHANQWAVTDNGLENCVPVDNRCIAKGFVSRVTENNTHLQSQPQNKTEQDVLKVGTEFLWQSSIAWLRKGIIGVTSVINRLLHPTPALIGTTSSVSTTITPQESYEACSATIATWRSDTARRQMYLNELRNISDFTADPIVSIEPDGYEEVFDIEVDRTENFIANGVVSHNTRWAKRDLTGQILKNSGKEGTDSWEVIEFPAILPSGNVLWPEFWKKEELDAIKAELPVSKWEAQYQQNPTSEEGAIIKRDWWRIWEHEDPPNCEYIIQSWDTAFEKKTRADFSACTTWGVFQAPDKNGKDSPNIILLDAFKDRMEFPDLKQKAKELWQEFNPDTLIIEKRAAGAPLIYELRRMGIPLSEYTPYKGQDKVARVNSIADLFASGVVWRPETRWAEEVVEEMAAFPNSDHDDLTDSSSQALMRFRQGGFIRINNDEPEEEFINRRQIAFY